MHLMACLYTEYCNKYNITITIILVTCLYYNYNSDIINLWPNLMPTSQAYYLLAQLL